jgi:GntR family transcriptional regulator
MADPMYRQIAEKLRARIESGELPPGSRLPSELELREMYGNASRNTVRDAIKSLVNRGLVQTRPGQGTFVANLIVPFATTMSTDAGTGLGGGEGVAYMAEARAQSRTPDATVPRVEIQPASKPAQGGVARQLQLDGAALVVSRHQELKIDDQPWSLQTSFYPYKFVELGATRLVQAEHIRPGAVRYVEQTLKLIQAGYQDKVSARPPNDAEATFFHLSGNGAVAVIETIRTAYERSGSPIRCTLTVWPADRNLLVYNFGRVPEAVTAVD